jgi:hypothetical protein
MAIKVLGGHGPAEKMCSAAIAMIFFGIMDICPVNAQVTWRRTYGGAGSDLARFAAPTPDGGFLIAGATGSFGQGGDAYLMKVDAEGEREWSGYYGGIAVEEAWSIAVADDGYFIAGTSSGGGLGGYDGAVIRIDLLGQVLWSRSYGTPDWDFIYAIAADDVGLYLAGRTYGGTLGGADHWILRTDVVGEVIWSSLQGGVYEDEARDVQATADGGCIVVGTMGISDGTSDVHLMKFTSSGGMEWDTTIGTDSIDLGQSVRATMEGTYIIGGSSRGFSSNSEMYLAEVDQFGSIQWTNHVGQISDWEGYDALQRPDGGLTMVGYTTAFGLGGKDVYLLMTNAVGEFEFGTTFGGGGEDVGYSIELTGDGGYILAGSTTSFGPGPGAMFVIRTGLNGLTQSEQVQETFDPVSIATIELDSEWTIIPNPVESGGTVEIVNGIMPMESFRISDMQGRELKQGPVVLGKFIDIGYIHSGMYGVDLIDMNGNRSFSRIVVVNP